MFFVYRQIKKHVLARQQQDVAQAEPVTEVKIAAPGTSPMQQGAARAQPYIANSCNDAQAAENVLSAKALAAQLPQDPSLEANWPRTKRLSHLVVNVLGLSLAIDYTMSLMSIQALYYVVGGSARLYGLTFGSYDLTALIFAPLFGLCLDMTARYKPQAAFGIACSITGNVLYGLTLLVGSWSMMLSGRLVAGIGAALMGVGSTYITSTTTMAVRTNHLARYRIWQSIARTMGPFVGYLFLSLPETSADNTNKVLDVFNWYTISGWVAAFVVLIVGAAYLWLFTEPTHENGHLETLDDSTAAPEQERAEHKRVFGRMAVMYLPLVLISQLAIWAFFSNLFALFAGQFHGVTDQLGQWKTFIGAGAGSVAGGLLYRKLARTMRCVELPALAAAALLMLPAWLMVIPYGGSTEVLPVGLFYAASVLSGAAVTVSAASQEAFFSKKITQHAVGVGSHTGKLLGLIFMLSSAGRFAGPLIAGAATLLATPSGAQQVCGGPLEQQCCIQADAYYINGCVLLNAREFYATMAAVQGAVFLWSLLVLYYHGRYDSRDTPRAAFK